MSNDKMFKKKIFTSNNPLKQDNGTQREPVILTFNQNLDEKI